MESLANTNDNGNGQTRKKLTDIINGGAESLLAAWATTTAANDFVALPAGAYIARIIGGELVSAKTGTPEYKLTFKVLEGDHAGRQFWHDIWLTPAAVSMAKRDLGKLGVTSPDQLDSPLPPGIRCKVKLALRTGDDGAEYNRVRSFEVLGIDKVEDDAFPPAPSPQATVTPRSGDPIKSNGDTQPTMFPPEESQARPAQAAGL